MPLQNRVDPFGNLAADAARGLFLGNRGGRLHRDDRSLASRRYVSRTWICCRLAFKKRRREVWGKGYTELFFLDEPTALSAGHRPCFECRRHDAQNFAAAIATGTEHAERLMAADLDRLLHAQRLDGRSQRRHRLSIDDLPDGAFVTFAQEPGSAFAVRGAALLRWTPAAYTERRPRPRAITVDVLTPPVSLIALAAGYQPCWHPSADDFCRVG